MQNSKIEWCDHTFNPWIGCTKVSDGCKHCYAEALMDKRWGKVQWGPAGTRVRTKPSYWKQPLIWDAKAKAEGRRPKVFCASLADVFEDRSELLPWREDLFALIDQTPHLDWLLLTKRPENVESMVAEMTAGHLNIQDWDNIWLGTSVENQAAADERIPHLAAIPVAVRFLSMEPLLGPVDLGVDSDLAVKMMDRRAFPLDYIDWVIIGGESGQKARPMNPAWVRLLRDHCIDAGVPFFFKQWGEWLSQDQMTDDFYYDRVAVYDPESVGGVSRFKCDNLLQGADLLWRVGKANAGRLLDGVVWSQFPA